MHTVKLPAKHAYDWWQRCGVDYTDDGSCLEDSTERTVTLRLSTVALADLVSDSKFYAECMGPEDTGYIEEDYRPAARRCLAKLEKLGLL